MSKERKVQQPVKLHRFFLDRGTMRFRCDLCALPMNTGIECLHADAPVWNPPERKKKQKEPMPPGELLEQNEY